MVFESGKVNKVLTLPECRHLPRHFLDCFRRRGMDCFADGFKEQLDLFRLVGDIVVDGADLVEYGIKNTTPEMGFVH